MRLIIGNTTAQVLEATAEEAAWLLGYLSFVDQGTAFVQRKGHRAKRVKPKTVRLYNPLTDTFPTGLLRLVYDRATEQGFKVLWQDGRGPGLAVDPQADLAWLRPYQRDAVDAAVARERGMLWLPTGSGKTEVAIGLTRVLPHPWLFVVHRSDIMWQTAGRFRHRALVGYSPEQEAAVRLGDVGVGVFGDGHYEVGDRLTVATFQTLRSRVGTAEFKLLASTAKGLIVDEAHTLPADSFFDVCMRLHAARYRIGLSGTPLARDDKRSLMAVGALGPVIFRLRADELINAGVLAKPRIKMVAVEQYETAPTYRGIYGKAVVRSTARNKALVTVAKLASKPALLYVRDLAHGKLLVPRLENAGLRVAFVWGNSSKAKREAAVQGLERGDLDVVVCSVIWQEGIDIPELASVIVGAAGKSAIAALQRLGRGMRRPDGKDTFDVWDVDDVGTPVLERHARTRRRIYEKEGFDVEDVDLEQLPLAAV